MKYDTILLDFDDTIVDFFDAEDRAFHQMAHHFGHYPTEEDFQYFKKVNQNHWEAFQKNELSKEEVLTHRFINYFKEYGIDVDGKKADVLFRDELAKAPLKFFNSTLETIEVKECSGISKENFFDNIEDCFEITEFHIQLEKGKEILKLHLLRCALREVSLEISESYKHDESQTGNEIVKNVNSIINSISQMICITVGGERCQRKV